MASSRLGLSGRGAIAYNRDMPSAQRASARRWTWSAYAALADDDRRELIDGELVEGGPASRRSRW